VAVRLAAMHVPVDRFIAVLDDYTILYLQTCAKCQVLITYAEQGHHCGGQLDASERQRIEAFNYVQIMQRVKKIYSQMNSDAPRV
jgi:hypothetical protein